MVIGATSVNYSYSSRGINSTTHFMHSLCLQDNSIGNVFFNKNITWLQQLQILSALYYEYFIAKNGIFYLSKIVLSFQCLYRYHLQNIMS